jgi:predicted CoA-binding protein
MSAIDEFFQSGRYAIVELDPSAGYGQSVYRKLSSHGREAVVVMRATPGTPAALPATYSDLRDVPGTLDGVLFNVEDDPQRILHDTRTAIAKGAKRIWIENRCEAGEAVDYARKQGVMVVNNVCPLLALEPDGVHWLHRKILDVLGKTPAPVAIDA